MWYHWASERWRQLTVARVQSKGSQSGQPPNTQTHHALLHPLSCIHHHPNPCSPSPFYLYSSLYPPDVVWLNMFLFGRRSKVRWVNLLVITINKWINRKPTSASMFFLSKRREGVHLSCLSRYWWWVPGVVGFNLGGGTVWVNVCNFRNRNSEKQNTQLTCCSIVCCR